MIKEQSGLLLNMLHLLTCYKYVISLINLILDKMI